MTRKLSLHTHIYGENHYRGNNAKPVEEEPETLNRVQAILDSPSYRLAAQDADFLDRDKTRGVRLQIDYLKTELLLEQHGVEHTIVVFGSTRIRESLASNHRVEEFLAELTADPGNVVLERQLEVAKRV